MLLCLSAGAVNFGGLFASTIDTSASARAGARAGALGRINGPASDYQILKAVKMAGGKGSKEISRIVIYRAASPTAGPPSDCKTSPVAIQGECNIYTGNDLDLDEAALLGSSGANGWPNTARQPGVDYIGVWIRVNHPSAMKLVPSPEKYEDNVTMLMEPAATTWSGSDWTSGGGGDPGWDDSFWCWNGCHTPGGPAGVEPPPSGLGSSA